MRVSGAVVCHCVGRTVSGQKETIRWTLAVEASHLKRQFHITGQKDVQKTPKVMFWAIRHIPILLSSLILSNLLTACDSNRLSVCRIVQRSLLLDNPINAS